jgi:hypothetical protein
MSDYPDIVPRLRDPNLRLHPHIDELADEAADTIEQLRLERDAANDRVALLQHEVRL